MEELSVRILLSSNWVNLFRSLDKQKAGAHVLSSRIPEIMIPCFISVALAEKHSISVILLLWCFLRSLIFFFFFPFACLAAQRSFQNDFYAVKVASFSQSVFAWRLSLGGKCLHRRGYSYRTALISGEFALWGLLSPGFMPWTDLLLEGLPIQQARYRWSVLLSSLFDLHM